MAGAQLQVTPALIELCRRWNIDRLEVFGSAVRHDFRPDSDIDLLVTFKPGVRLRWNEEERLRAELGSFFARRIDLMPRRVIEQSRNPYRRHNILSSATLLYAA